MIVWGGGVFLIIDILLPDRAEIRLYKRISTASLCGSLTGLTWEGTNKPPVLLGADSNPENSGGVSPKHLAPTSACMLPKV